MLHLKDRKLEKLLNDISDNRFIQLLNSSDYLDFGDGFEPFYQVQLPLVLGNNKREITLVFKKYEVVLETE